MLDHHHQQCILQEIAITCHEMQRPSIMLRAEVTQVFGLWQAKYSGVVATGCTPAEAAANFDKLWWGRK